MARKMKDSGVEWIGEIPEDWEVCRIKDYFLIKNGATPSSGNVDYWNGDIPWITPSDYKTNDVYIDNSSRTITQEGYDSCGTNMVPTDSIIISNRAPIGSVGIAKVSLCTSQGCKSLVRRREIESKFVYYYLSISSSELNILGRGTTFLELSSYDLGMFDMTIPNINEQDQIVNFLDEKVGEIDSVIAKTKETIEDYNKYKQAIITDAVTKGLNLDVEMKESGIEWIGKIPIHWGIIKAKNIVMITNGADPKTEGNIPVYGSGAQSFKTCGEYKEGPTVLIGRKGATLHIPHYIDGKYWNVDTAFDVKQKNEKIALKYYYYNAICFDYKKFISQTTLPSMTQTDYGNMYIPYPNRDEQNIIVEYLDEKCSEIDRLIANKEELLVDLESYKKSLIYEYVTGKKEV